MYRLYRRTTLAHTTQTRTRGSVSQHKLLSFPLLSRVENFILEKFQSCDIEDSEHQAFLLAVATTKLL
ncbi:hypothetical protein KDA_04360 [Dictyobacter alpinus]|uniref:Uncharacterized protein n=1 Tax=Dictyobacter alpinus TaxID=2014873 RepID=A0A402B0T6_9CHLR|nr:hypothetical protein KDA_04360 [Dictyobacter alpinus]